MTFFINEKEAGRISVSLFSSYCIYDMIKKMGLKGDIIQGGWKA